MSKKVFMYVNGVIRTLRDISRQHPKSIFDNEYMSNLKEAHLKYGIKLTLNLFYRTDFFYGDDEFSLSEMTDDYKKEWEENSDWLKLSAQSKQEYPDYPFVNIDYDDAKAVFGRIKNEIYRFAGEKSFSANTIIPWHAISKDGCRALYDLGIKSINMTEGKASEFNGDILSLPHGHAQRLLSNRKPETKVWFWNDKFHSDIANAICGYNHLEDGIPPVNGKKQYVYKDEETGISFINLDRGASLKQYNTNGLSVYFKQSNLKKDNVIVPCSYHEMYFYDDFYMYQPDYADKMLLAAKTYKENDFEFIFADELL